MTQPKPPLSPAAQAVLDAANNASSFGPDEIPCDARWIAAAVLRAAVENAAETVYISCDGEYSVIFEDDLLAIAAELENFNA